MVYARQAIKTKPLDRLRFAIAASNVFIARFSAVVNVRLASWITVHVSRNSTEAYRY